MSNPQRIKFRWFGHKKPVGIRITKNQFGDGIFVKAGPLVGTMTPDAAYQLANTIADTLEGNTNQ